MADNQAVDEVKELLKDTSTLGEKMTPDTYIKIGLGNQTAYDYALQQISNLKKSIISQELVPTEKSTQYITFATNQPDIYYEELVVSRTTGPEVLARKLIRMGEKKAQKLIDSPENCAPHNPSSYSS